MLRFIALLAAVLVLVVAAVLPAAEPKPAAAPPGAGDAKKVRVGVYDNRSVAVAYAASRFNPVREKNAEHRAAKQAGDEQKVKELEAWGASHQRMLHFQGFCRVPVTELLEPVKPGMREIVARERLVAIVPACDVHAADVELVDVTPQLVELFEPTAKAREQALKIREVAPVPLTKIADHPAGH